MVDQKKLRRVVFIINRLIIFLTLLAYMLSQVPEEPAYPIVPLPDDEETPAPEEPNEEAPGSEEPNEEDSAPEPNEEVPALQEPNEDAPALEELLPDDEKAPTPTGRGQADDLPSWLLADLDSLQNNLNQQTDPE